MVLAGGAFDGGEYLIGDLGHVRELWDLGDSTPAGPGFREVVRVAFELATTVVVLLRFFGFARSSAASEGRFSLSSPVEISSLVAVS